MKNNMKRIFFYVVGGIAISMLLSSCAGTRYAEPYRYRIKTGAIPCPTVSGKARRSFKDAFYQ
jgi:hypothetical protein